MAISYQSDRIFKSSPYIQPVDLGLMSNILQYKDATFNANAAKTQQQIDAFGSMDVMKQEDREYLNSKVNGLVENINKIGGVDLGNPSTLNQIESLGQDIYGDNNILNAVASTRAVRKLQGEYEKFRLDPKFKGYYSNVNEAYDMSGVNKWVSDGKVGSNYSGATSATAFYDLDKETAKSLKDVKAEYIQDVTTNGWYINKSTRESKSEAELAQIARDRILNNPQARDQAVRNAWYTTENSGLTGKDVVGGLVNNAQSYIDLQNQNIKYFDDRMKLAVNDPQTYQLLKKQKEAAIKNKTDWELSKTKYQTEGLANYEKNPQSYQLDFYLNNFTRGLARTYEINKQLQDVRPDAAKMFQANYAQKERQMEMQAAVHGLIKVPDPTNPNGYSWLKAGTNSGNITVNPPDVDTAADPKAAYEVTLDKVKEENNNLYKDNQTSMVGWIQDLAAINPSLKYLLNDKGQIAGQEFLTKQGGDNVFDITDLQYIPEAVREGVLNGQQAKFMKDLYYAWKSKAIGKTVDYRALPDGVDKLFSKLELNNRQAALNTTMIDNFNSPLFKAAALTPAEQMLYKDYQLHPEKYTEVVEAPVLDQPGGLTTVNVISNLLSFEPINTPSQKIQLNEKIQSIQDKIDKVPEQDKNNYWQQFSLRPQYTYQTFSTKEQKEGLGDVKGVIMREARNIPALSGRTAEEIDINDVGRRTDGVDGWKVGVTLTTGKLDKKTTTIVDVPLPESYIRSRFQIAALPREVELASKEVEYNKVSAPIRLIGNKGATVTVKAVKTPGDNSYYMKLITPTGEEIRMTPNLPSVATAYDAAQKYFTGYLQSSLNQGEFNFNNYRQIVEQTSYDLR